MDRKERSIPKAAKPHKNNHLAEGEMTGHFHAAVGKDVAVKVLDNRMFLEAPHGATVTHQEHADIEVPASEKTETYTVERVKEYDAFAEESREVSD